MTQNATELAPWEESTAEPQPIAEFEAFADPDERDAIDDETVPPEKEPIIDEIASEFVGFWNLLVSKTNWEKGKVIHSWRVKLQEAGMPRRVYSDEAISQRIKDVTPQHVGRLRRVYERFGEQEILPNLYWSHYQAALDWDDADEWLQKASAEGLSIAQMRLERWEKFGASLKTKPKDDEIVTAEIDEDVNPYNDEGSLAVEPKITEDVDGKRAKEKKDDKEDKKKKKAKKSQESELGEFAGEVEPWESDPDAAPEFTTADVLDAINKLDPLPNDFQEAIENLKVAILTRKIEEWKDVQPIQIAAYLSELKRLLVSLEK